nr:SEC10/PgrA surface exclusion domain-containing protein [Limosilactobacillus mucosae]
MTLSVDQAQAKTDAQQKVTNTVADNLKNAQDILNNSATAKANADQALADAKKKTDEAQANVNGKSVAEADAATTKVNADGALTDAQNAKTTADAKLTDAQNTQTAAQAKADAVSQTQKTAQNAYDATNSKLSDVQDKLDNLNSITVSDEYVQALKAFFNEKNATTSQAVKDAAQRLISENQYKSNKADQQTQITFGPDQPLSADVELELTQFVAELLNPIRAKLGMIPLTINQGSLDFTKAISQGYDATGWHIVVKGWHDTKTINEAAADFGLAHGPFKDYLPQMYEDAQSGYWINGNPASPMTFTKTLDELKSQLYGAVTDMLFQDASQTITDESAKDDWGHAKGVTGLTNSVGNPTTEALGVMIDSMGNVHIISVTNNHVVDNAGKYAQEMNSKYAVPDQLTELTS